MSRSHSDFVADYAAKRAAQMERAKMLREQRRETTKGSQQLPSSQQPQSSYQREEDNYYNDRRGAPTSPHVDSGYNRGGSDVAYPPPVSSSQNRLPPQTQQPTRMQAHSSYQPQQQQYQTQQYSSSRPSASIRERDEVVEVSQEDFNRAVAMGIISADQSRHLWAALTSGSSAPPPMMMTTQTPSRSSGVRQSTQQQPPARESNPYTTLDDQRVGGGGGGYNANNYAPPSAGAQLDALPAGVGARGNGVKKSSKPEWNFETDANDFHEDERQPTPELAPRGSKPSGKRVTQKEWNNDFVDENVLSEPAPVPKRAPSKTATKQTKTTAQPQQQDQMQQGRGVPLSLRPTSQQQQPQRGNNNKPQTPPSAPAQSQDEVEDFLRQKEEAARRLEEELNQVPSEPMVPCNICGRRFREGIIDRHEQACQKANKKRREFNTAAQRADGVEGLKEAQRQAKREEKTSKPKQQQQQQMPANKLPKWKIQSMQLQAAMAAVKGGGGGGGGMGMGGAPPPQNIDDRVPCPHCGRKFASDVADRHIPKCKTTQAKPTMLVRRR